MKWRFQKQYNELNRELGSWLRIAWFYTLSCSQRIWGGFEGHRRLHNLECPQKQNKPVAQEKHDYSWYKIWKKLLPGVLTKGSKPHPQSHPLGHAAVGCRGMFASTPQCGPMAQGQGLDPGSNSPRNQIKTAQVYNSLIVCLNPKRTSGDSGGIL